MREIKFRATVVKSSLHGYHGMPDSRFAGVDTYETSIIVNGIYWNEGKIDFVTDNDGEEYSFSDNTLLVLEQYTGMNDSKGFEIYEGDILKIWEEDSFVANHDSGGGIIDYDINEGFAQFGVVAFHDTWFTYETKKHLAGIEMNCFSPLESFNNCKVVGNIHDHSHLLK